MKLWLLSLLIASGFAQTSNVPYAPNSDAPGPTFTVQEVHNCYPGSVSSIRAIDFRNFQFLEFGEDGKPSDHDAMKNGHSQRDAEFDHSETDLDSIHYLPKSDSSIGDSALVILSWSAVAGSSSQGGSAKLFNLSGNRLCVVQEIDWDTHFGTRPPYWSFDASTNALVIRSAHYIPGDAHCCVSAMDVVTLRWGGTRFTPAALRTELSDYGRAEGKTLPRLDPR